MNDNHKESNSFDNTNELQLNTSSPAGTAKPDPKEIAEIFQNTSREEKSKSSSQNRGLSYLLVIAIVLVGFVLLWQLSLQRQIDSIRADLNVTPVIDNQGDQAVPTPAQKISVITPEEFAEVNGEFEVSMEVEGANFVNFRLLDDNGVEISTDSVDTSGSLQEKTAYQKTLSVTKSPTVSSGYLIVYPGDKTFNSSQAVTTSVKFTQNATVNKLVMIGPLTNQLVNSTSLRFTGEMKGFEENTVNFVVRDDKGVDLTSGSFSADSLDISENFVKFDKTVTIGTLSAGVSETGTIDFYGSDLEETSPVLSIPVKTR